MLGPKGRQAPPQANHQGLAPRGLERPLRVSGGNPGCFPKTARITDDHGSARERRPADPRNRLGTSRGRARPRRLRARRTVLRRRRRRRLPHLHHPRFRAEKLDVETLATMLIDAARQVTGCAVVGRRRSGTQVLPFAARIRSPVNPTEHTTRRPLPEPRRPGPSRRARRSAQRPLAIRVRPRRRYRRCCRPRTADVSTARPGRRTR